MEAVVERLGPADWQRVREVRLRSLRDSPDAFAETADHAAATSSEEWRARLTRTDAATFVARIGERDVGLAIGADYRGQEGDAGLFGVWVAPEARGRGLGAALIGNVIEWARVAGYRHLLLDVGDRNVHAGRLYERMGFLPTGRTGALPPPREHITEHERALEL